MDRFVNRQNIERYRRLANEATNATERLRIFELLAEEKAKFKLEFRVPGATRRTCVRNFSAAVEIDPRGDAYSTLLKSSHNVADGGGCFGE